MRMCDCKRRPLWAQTITDVFVYELLRRLIHLENFCFRVPFLKQLLLRNCTVDFVEICNVHVGKMVMKAAKRIFNSDKICRSYSDLNFGVTFFGTQCRYTEGPGSWDWTLYLKLKLHFRVVERRHPIVTYYRYTILSVVPSYSIFPPKLVSASRPSKQAWSTSNV